MWLIKYPVVVVSAGVSGPSSVFGKPVSFVSRRAGGLRAKVAGISAKRRKDLICISEEMRGVAMDNYV